MIGLGIALIFTMLILVMVKPEAAAGLFVLGLVGGMIWYLATHFTIVVVPV